MTPVKGGRPVPSIFYCGLVATELRAKHSELLENNTDGSRFFQCHNPLMFPLPSIPENTEDHPDHVKHHKRRQEMAEKAEPVAITVIPTAQSSPAPETTLPIPGTEPIIPIPVTREGRRAQLLAMRHGELLAIVKGLKDAGKPAGLTIGTKAQLTAEILRAEGLELAGAALPPGSDSAPQ